MIHFVLMFFIEIFKVLREGPRVVLVCFAYGCIVVPTALVEKTILSHRNPPAFLGKNRLTS